LTMIPNWRAALGNALAMLRPGGALGVVDFYVSTAHATPGLVRHDAITRHFWPRWFRRDGVHLSAAHLPWLRANSDQAFLLERRSPVPYLPGLSVPYYVFVGRKRGATRTSGGCEE
jgi:S-adenosylmethionine-diacylgycerolhomoserine-N-methlytransferase